MTSFEPGDMVLYCPYPGYSLDAPFEALVLAVTQWGATIQRSTRDDDNLEEADEPFDVTEGDLYLLAPSRRPFLDDVERSVRRRFHRRAADAMHKYWLEVSRRSTGAEDDATLTDLLRGMKEVRAQAWAAGDRQFEAVRDQLRAEVTGPEAWRVAHVRWLTDDAAVVWADGEIDIARAMRDRCIAAAERLGLDEIDL